MNYIFLLILLVAPAIHAQNGKKERTLVDVARSGEIDQVKELLDKGANPNARDEVNQQTALTKALDRATSTSLNHQDFINYVKTADIIAKELLNRGAQPQQEDLLTAVRLGLVDVVKMMQPKLSNSAAILGNPETLTFSFYSGSESEPMVAYLLELGNNPNVQDQGISILTKAIGKYFKNNGEGVPLGVIELLLQKGAQVDDKIIELTGNGQEGSQDKKKALQDLLAKYKK